MNSLRDSVLVVPGAICPEDLDYLDAHIAQAPMNESLVSNFGADGEGELAWVVDHAVRHTQEVALPPPVRVRIAQLHEACVVAHINPFYEWPVRDAEPFQLLHYGTQGHYAPHVDAETPLRDADDREFWEKSLDRDLSVVYFLSDDFAGGELVFPTLELVLKPARGTLVCFPSDHHFLHGVQPVTQGHRYTLVSWLRVQGMPTPDDLNASAIEAFSLAWPGPYSPLPRILKAG
jgi:predicted 2-oxoglutarate/Fe(II)-dependent dioxygenase YbiX